MTTSDVMTCFDLVRRFRHSTCLDFTAPQECPSCRGKLEVKDHRAPWFSPPYTASKEWRYEVTCETCGWCDCNGYTNRREVLEAYPAKPLGITAAALSDIERGMVDPNLNPNPEERP